VIRGGAEAPPFGSDLEERGPDRVQTRIDQLHDHLELFHKFSFRNYDLTQLGNLVALTFLGPCPITPAPHHINSISEGRKGARCQRLGVSRRGEDRTLFVTNRRAKYATKSSDRRSGEAIRSARTHELRVRKRVLSSKRPAEAPSAAYAT
jgi:hypothetical protein